MAIWVRNDPYLHPTRARTGTVCRIRIGDDVVWPVEGTAELTAALHGLVGRLVGDDFARLREPNRFEADVNQFETVKANQYFTTSDPRCKRNVVLLDPMESLCLVQATPVYRYELVNNAQGSLCCGFMATETPAAHTRMDDRTRRLGVDYQSMQAHLWATVQYLVRRVDAQSKKGPTEQKMTPIQCTLTALVLIPLLVWHLSPPPGRRCDHRSPGCVWVCGYDRYDRYEGGEEDAPIPPKGKRPAGDDPGGEPAAEDAVPALEVFRPV